MSTGSDATTEAPSPVPDEDQIRRAPKVLLHDHLDGGLRPQTVIELADQYGYPGLPEYEAEQRGWAAGSPKRRTPDPSPATWRRSSTQSG